MSVFIHSARLRRELALRGLSASEMAHEAGVSAATVSAALAGRPISVHSLSLMIKVLLRIPVMDVADSLLLSEPEDRGIE
jgi:transcriptional regulator with XRE-family HTH domain